MLRSVFIYEWKLLFRKKAVLFSLIAFTLIGILSVNRGVQYFHIQQQETDSIQVAFQKSYEKLKVNFDTLHFTQEERHFIENPWQIDRRLGEYAVKPSNALSAMSIGQNDVYSRIKQTRIATDIFGATMDEFKNPEQLLTGNLDLSYFILFLFPILFIALSYNAASADREAGLSKLIAVQKGQIKKVVIAKVFFQWLIAIVPVIIAMVYAFIRIYPESSFSFLAFLQWTSMALLYTFLWLSIVLFITGRGWHSMVNILSLTGVWLLFLASIPGVLNTWFQYKYPNYIQQEIAHLRDYKDEYLELPVAEHEKHLYNLIPALKNNHLPIDSSELRWASYSHMGLQKEKELYSEIKQRADAQHKKEQQLFWINPAGGIMSAFSHISQSNLSYQRKFEESVIDLREKRHRYYFTHFFSKPHFTNEEFTGIPLYQSALPNQPLPFSSWLPSVLISVLLLSATIAKKERVL